MTKINLRFYFTVIIHSIVISLLIIPVGKSLIYPGLPSIDTSPSSVTFYLIAIISPILLIINIFLAWGTSHLRKWNKLYIIFALFDLIIFISNHFPFLSAMGNLGYINMLIPDILLRIITMVFCFYLINKWMVMEYPVEEHEAGRIIIKTFAIVQILLFSIAAWGNWLALVK